METEPFHLYIGGEQQLLSPCSITCSAMRRTCDPASSVNRKPLHFTRWCRVLLRKRRWTKGNHARTTPSIHACFTGSPQRSRGDLRVVVIMFNGIFFHLVHQALSGNGEESCSSGYLTSGFFQCRKNDFLFNAFQLFGEGFGRI